MLLILVWMTLAVFFLTHNNVNINFTQSIRWLTKTQLTAGAKYTIINYTDPYDDFSRMLCDVALMQMQQDWWKGSTMKVSRPSVQLSQFLTSMMHNTFTLLLPTFFIFFDTLSTVHLDPLHLLYVLCIIVLLIC